MGFHGLDNTWLAVGSNCVFVSYCLFSFLKQVSTYFSCFGESNEPTGMQFLMSVHSLCWDVPWQQPGLPTPCDLLCVTSLNPAETRYFYLQNPQMPKCQVILILGENDAKRLFKGDFVWLFLYATVNNWAFYCLLPKTLQTFWKKKHRHWAFWVVTYCDLIAEIE